MTQANRRLPCGSVNNHPFLEDSAFLGPTLRFADIFVVFSLFGLKGKRFHDCTYLHIFSRGLKQLEDSGRIGQSSAQIRVGAPCLLSQITPSLVGCGSTRPIHLGHPGTAGSWVYQSYHYHGRCSLSRRWNLSHGRCTDHTT